MLISPYKSALFCLVCFEELALPHFGSEILLSGIGNFDFGESKFQCNGYMTSFCSDTSFKNINYDL